MNDCTHTMGDSEKWIVSGSNCPLCLESELSAAKAEIERINSFSGKGAGMWKPRALAAESEIKRRDARNDGVWSNGAYYLMRDRAVAAEARVKELEPLANDHEAMRDALGTAHRRANDLEAREAELRAECLRLTEEVERLDRGQAVTKRVSDTEAELRAEVEKLKDDLAKCQEAIQNPSCDHCLTVHERRYPSCCTNFEEYLEEAYKVKVERLKSENLALKENLLRESQLAVDMRDGQDKLIERCAKTIESKWPEAAVLLRQHPDGICGEDYGELKRENLSLSLALRSKDEALKKAEELYSAAWHLGDGAEEPVGDGDLATVKVDASNYARVVDALDAIDDHDSGKKNVIRKALSIQPSPELAEALLELEKAAIQIKKEIEFSDPKAKIDWLDEPLAVLTISLTRLDAVRGGKQ